jgi:hypothetical protein
MLPSVAGAGREVGGAARRGAVLDAVRLARTVPLGSAADDAVLRRKIAECYRHWYERIDARPGTVVPRGPVLAVCVTVCVIPVLGLVARFTGGMRDVVLIVYEVDAAALVVAVLQLAGPLLRIAAREVLFAVRWLWMLLLGGSRPARPGLLPPDGMLILLKVTAALREAVGGGVMPTASVLAALATELSRAARSIAADPEMSGVRVARRLLAVRRERNLRLSFALDQVANKILAVDGPERLERIGAFLTEALRAWACGGLTAFVADLPPPRRTLSRPAWLWAHARGAVLAAAALAAWLVGGRVAAYTGPLLVLGAVLQVGLPGPVDTAKYLISGVSPAGASSK